MAKTSAKQMSGIPTTAPHGMSLQAKPLRMPHPVHAGRDQFGRMLPGQLPKNAAPPFKKVAVAAVVKPRPGKLKPPMPPRPIGF